MQNTATQNDKNITSSENIYNTFLNKENESLYNFNFNLLKDDFGDDEKLNDFLRSIEFFRKNNENEFFLLYGSIPNTNKYKSIYTKKTNVEFEYNWELQGLDKLLTKAIDTKILLHFIININNSDQDELKKNEWLEKLLSIEFYLKADTKKVNLIKEYIKKL